MTKEELREKANSLPLQPGVYRMFDGEGTVIYVGKAKRLRNRVSQYFQDTAGHNRKTRVMVGQIDHFDTIVVSTEWEALLLENALIKRYRPRYNILLKDDKGYPFIRVDMQAEYPRFSLCSQPKEDGARYFGPYAARHESRAAIEAICTALKLPSCHRSFPRDIGRERPCLNYDMGRCEGFCRQEASAEEYRQRIEQAVLLLEGKYQSLRRQLRQEMQEESERLHFERCAVLRDRIRALERLGQKQKVIAGLCADTDLWGLVLEEKHAAWAVLSVEEGQLMDRHSGALTLPEPAEEQEVLEQLLSRYYLGRSRLPKEILLPFAVEDMAQWETALGKQAEHRVYLRVPRRGEKAALQTLAEENARETLTRSFGQTVQRDGTALLLAELLQLPQPPQRLEAWDISNTGSSAIVAAMTVFVRGRPLKREWRRMQVKTVTGAADDYASMEEVLRRRFARYQAGDSGFSRLPDVLLMDGGATHAAVAERVLREFSLELPVFGMVKDDRHRTRALMTAEGREIGIRTQPAVFALIGRIQEATHHYAVEYHHQTHQRAQLRSRLEDIEGVGTKRREQLLQRFGSLRGVQKATEQELAAVVPRSTAHQIWKYFHKEGEP